MLSFYRKTDSSCFFSPIESAEKGCWIHAEAASEEDILYLCERTNIPRAELIDALDHHELPRMESMKDHLIVFIRHPIDKKGHLHTAPLTILLKGDEFITISPVKSTLIAEMLKRRHKDPLKNNEDILVEILQLTAADFSIETKKARQSVMAQRKEIHSVDSSDISSLTEEEEVLNQYLASLIPFEETLQEMLSLEVSKKNQDIHSKLGDICNSIKQSLTICNTLTQNIRSLRDSYQIIFANKITHTIKLLTALTIIFSIPNMIASIYGMNVKLPIAASSHAFGFLLVVMSVSSILCGYWFYRKKWM